VKSQTVTFALKGAPGDPRFSGELSADGKTISGTFSQGGGSLPLSLTLKGPAKFEIPQKSTPVNGGDVKSRKPYPVSMMPVGLVNSLNKDELLDLLAYIQSGGNANDKAFAK